MRLPLVLAMVLWAGSSGAAQVCPTGNERSAPDSRYVASEPRTGERVVTDGTTALMWKQCIEGQSGTGCASGSPISANWAQALATARASGFAGFTDWRLPNPMELASLIETGCHSPAVNESFFPATPLGGQWSATTQHDAPQAAWLLDSGRGELGTGLKSEARQVRLVRGGRGYDAFTAVDNDRSVAPITPAADNGSLAPRSDAAGRFIVFQSRASNLVPGASGKADTNNAADIFRTDTQTGQTVLVSLDNAGAQFSADSAEPSVSADGKLVVFISPDAGVAKVWGESKSAAEQRIKQAGWGIFMRNMVAATTQRLGAALPTGSGSNPEISPNGNAVVFSTLNTNPAVGAMGQENVFLMPLARGGDTVTPGNLACVSCKSVSAMGVPVANADGASSDAVLSADGRFVAFETLAKNVTAGTPSPCAASATVEVILRDLLSGLTQRLAPPPNLAPANCGTAGSSNPAMDFSGQVIAFQSDQPLKAGDINLMPDVFSAVIGAGSPVFARASERGNGSDGDGVSGQVAMSGDGQTLVFVSTSTNLDSSFIDTNDKADLHAKRRNASGDPDRLSKSTSGVEANASSNRPALNYNATLIVFDSAASNLVTGDTNGQVDVFMRALPVNSDVVFAAGFE